MKKDDLYPIMRKTYDELIDFVLQPSFKKLVEELYELAPNERPNFVKTHILDSKELLKKGVNVPEGILIQRSSFGDRRPTLFVVKKYLPAGFNFAWENLNLTFDQDYEDSEISREGEKAWRKPLPFEVQAALSALKIKDTELAEIEKGR